MNKIETETYLVLYIRTNEEEEKNSVKKWFLQ